MNIKMGWLVFVIAICSPSLGMTSVPDNVESELLEQLARNGQVFVTIALDVEFEPNTENLTQQQLDDQVSNMSRIVQSFVRSMVKSKKFKRKDFHIIRGSMAPLLTVRVSQHNYQFILKDPLVLYYAPLSRVN